MMSCALDEATSEQNNLARTGRVSLPIHFAILTLAFFLLLSFLLGHDYGIAIYNSDVIHPFLLVGDLLRDRTALVDWHYSPALYVFPDWFLTAAVMVAPVTNGWLPLIYGALIMALYCLAGGAVLASSGSARMVTAAWAIAAALFFAGGAFLLFIDAPISPGVYSHLAAPYTHTGAVLATLAASALFLSLLSGHSGLGGAVGLAALVSAASFSDLLFVAWFVAPACGAALLNAWATRRSRGLLLAGLIGGAAAAGWMLEIPLHGADLLEYLAEKQSLQGSLGALWNTAKLSTEGDVVDVPIILITAMIIALLGRAAFLIVSLWRHRAVRADEFMELLLGGIVGQLWLCH